MRFVLGRSGSSFRLCANTRGSAAPVSRDVNLRDRLHFSSFRTPHPPNHNQQHRLTSKPNRQAAKPTPQNLLTMARNAEKSQSMLFRFREAQAADLCILDTNRTRRPKAISTQEHIPTCERWRGQVLKEISRKVSKIQDPALSDFQIRDVNDELNRLFREKWQWEMRIRELGGPNYMRGGLLWGVGRGIGILEGRRSCRA